MIEGLKTTPWGERKSNPYLLGGVCTNSKEILRRAREAIAFVSHSEEDELDVANSLPVYNADTYRPGRVVSFEEEGGRTLKIQERLDDQIVEENLNVDGDQLHVKGLPPCKRVGLKD